MTSAADPKRVEGQVDPKGSDAAAGTRSDIGSDTSALRPVKTGAGTGAAPASPAPTLGSDGALGAGTSPGDFSGATPPVAVGTAPNLPVSPAAAPTTGLGRGVPHSTFVDLHGTGASLGFSSGGGCHKNGGGWNFCFGFGWPSYCHSFWSGWCGYYNYCYWGWPSYCSWWWWPSWCYPVWWYRPWGWDYYRSYDYLYGYGGYAYEGYDSPVVVREVIREYPEVIEVERGTPRRASPEALAERFVREGDQAFKEARYQDAADAYLRALGHAPSDGSIHFVLADALFALGDYHYAAYVIRKGLELEPDLARSDVDKRTFYGKAAEFEKHLASLRDYISDHPFDAAAHLVLGYNLLFSKDVDGAEKAFKRALELNPGDSASKTFQAVITARKEKAAEKPETRRS